MSVLQGELLWSGSRAPEKTVGSAHYGVEQAVFSPSREQHQVLGHTNNTENVEEKNTLRVECLEKVIVAD